MYICSSCLHRKTIGNCPVCEVHMMVEQPHKWVKHMADAGANIYTFHYEATNTPHELIKQV